MLANSTFCVQENFNVEDNFFVPYRGIKYYMFSIFFFPEKNYFKKIKLISGRFLGYDFKNFAIFLKKIVLILVENKLKKF